MKDDESIEITINCHIESFQWIIDYLKTDEDDEDGMVKMISSIDDDNCLNIMISALFLGLDDLY